MEIKNYNYYRYGTETDAVVGYKGKSFQRHDNNSDIVAVAQDDSVLARKRGSDVSSNVSSSSRDTLFTNNNELPTSLKYDVIPEGSQESFENNLSLTEVCYSLFYKLLLLL